MPLKQWVKSANFAIEGILHAAETQRHVRYHLFSAAFVLLLSYSLGISKAEFLIIAIAVIAVLLAELLNTALETVVDMISPEHNEKAKAVKDVAAGAVLITAFGAAIIGYTILSEPVLKAFHEGFHIAKHSAGDVALAALILVLILVVITKAYFGKGSPLKGGLPSGHAALAFSVWVTVTYLTNDITVTVLCFLLALLIASSRVTLKIHTIWEVVLGALMGAAVTVLLFTVFS